MGLNLIFPYFTDICTRVSVLSEELTMQFHNASDNGTNFSPISVMSVQMQQPFKKYQRQSKTMSVLMCCWIPELVTSPSHVQLTF
jgi:hypothetical protein